MGENTQEKNLIEKKEGFFTKVKKFFKKLFKKQDEETKVEVDNDEINEVKENNEFKDYIKMTEDEETKLLELQRKYRRGEIAENDLTDDEIDALSDLYDKQIEALRRTIEEREQKIAQYKLRNKQRIEKNNA